MFIYNPKDDSNINIYNALNSNDKIQNNITYSRYSGCQIMNESPNLIPMRECIRRCEKK